MDLWIEEYWTLLILYSDERIFLDFNSNFYLVFPYGQNFPRLSTCGQFVVWVKLILDLLYRAVMSLYTPPPAMMWGGCIAIRASVCTSVHDPSHPQCSAYSSWWILLYWAQMTTSIRGCQTRWSLISIYIFNVNQPWLCNNSVKIWHTFLCPLCSKYNSGWIIFICGTNDH